MISAHLGDFTIKSKQVKLRAACFAPSSTDSQEGSATVLHDEDRFDPQTMSMGGTTRGVLTMTTTLLAEDWACKPTGGEEDGATWQSE